MLLRDGGSKILFDPHFTRCASPMGLPVMFRRISPDQAAIDKYLHKFRIEDSDAIIITHSHYDHTLDLPAVALKTGADVYGTKSTANIAIGGGVPESKIHIIGGGSKFKIGNFEIEAIRSKHVPLPILIGLFIGDGTEVSEPFAPPAKASKYREGGVLSFSIKHPKGKAIIMSGGPILDTQNDLSADIVVVSVGGLVFKARGYARRLYKNYIRRTGAKKIFISHWDDFTKPIEEALQPMIGFYRTMRLLRKFTNYGENASIARLDLDMEYNLFEQ